MSSFFSGMTSFMKGMIGMDNMEVTGNVTGSYTTEGQRLASDEEKRSLINRAMEYRGKDVTSVISLPVWVFEPTTFLVRMAEVTAFEEFLNKAGKAECEIERLGYIAAFMVAILSSTERTGKPFNPILGETFEYVSDKGFKFISEQVSHHPPIGVAETKNDRYTFLQESKVSTTFFGNSIEIYTQGYSQFITKDGSHYIWKTPTSAAYNLVVGGMWIDHFGEVEIHSITGNGPKCKLNFKKCGWFSEGRYEVEGSVLDTDGKERLVMAGKWNEFLVAAQVDEKGKRGKEYDLWRVDPSVKGFASQNKWNMPPYVINELLALDKGLEEILPDNDSRVRGDRLALELGDLEFASREKNRLEEKQRADRKERESNSEVYTPKYFKKIDTVQGPMEYTWQYVGGYWEERDQRILQAKTKDLAVKE